MTCIIGIAQEGKVYIGADSAAVDGWKVQQTGWSKIVRKGEFLFGVCGSFRSIQLLKNFLEVRPQAPGEDDEHYLVTGLSEAIRLCFKEHGLSKVDSNTENDTNFAALFGYRGRLYSVEGGANFQIIHLRRPYNACGGGMWFALGSLHTTEGRAPKTRILKALEATAVFYMGVCDPFEVEVLG